MDKFSLHIVTVDGHFWLCVVADDCHLRCSFKENNRNCTKPKTLGLCLQQQSVSEFRVGFGFRVGIMFTYAAHANTFVLSSFVTHLKSEMFSERADSSPCRRDPSSQSLQPPVDVCVIHMCMCAGEETRDFRIFFGLEVSQ